MDLSSIKGSISGFGMAMAPHPSVFAPLVFAGKLDEGLLALSMNGFQGVEISLRSTADIDTEWLVGRTAELGLTVLAFASGRMCIEESLCLSSPDPELRVMAVDRLQELIKLAAVFRAPLILGGVRGKLSGNDQQKKEQRLAAIYGMRKCAEMAADLGTFLLIEPINRYETNFINSAQQAMDIIDEINRPAIKLLLDTFHMNIEEVDLCDTITKVKDTLGYVHFADNNRLAPGKGHIDFPSILRALININFHGFISAEILPMPDDLSALKNTSMYIHSLLENERK